MYDPFPKLIWDQDLIHSELMTALDLSYNRLSDNSSFSSDWESWQCVSGTKTRVRQSPMLGNGASDRSTGGFYQFAKKYYDAEGITSTSLVDRCSFERYQDFAFFTSNNWYEGKKQLILISECESNPDELLGELAGLIAVRCPNKYLFIHGNHTLNRLNDYCADSKSHATDWANTNYYVIEIPDQPSPPSSWLKFIAKVKNTGEPLRFQVAADATS